MSILRRSRQLNLHMTKSNDDDSVARSWKAGSLSNLVATTAAALRRHLAPLLGISRITKLAVRGAHPLQRNLQVQEDSALVTA